jgi:hypothetical protein
MQVFWAVVLDLFEFLVATISRNVGAGRLALPLLTNALQAEVKREPDPIPEVPLPQPLPPALPLVPSTPRLPAITTTSQELSAAAYICVKKARVMQAPVWRIDTVLRELTYGTTVRILEYEGRFVRVFFDEFVGWVLKDEVTETATDVFPVLVSGVTYLAADSETKKLRMYISDEFFTQELYAPLQASEYVHYRLLQKNQTLPWPQVRPRVVGQWHVLLRGVPRMYTTILPKTGSIIEYTTESGAGFVGIVEAVTPEETITISGVGMSEEGVYSQTELTKPQWQEFRPVFMQII